MSDPIRVSPPKPVGLVADIKTVTAPSGLVSVTNSPTWNSVLNKPTSFTPSAHAATHSASGSDPLTLSKAQVGLGNVDNTADSAKPISTATQAALDGKATLVHSHSVSQIVDLAAVAKTGNYSDLTGKPTLGSAASQNTSAFDPAGAASSAQSAAVQRSNHTGTQSASTITGLAAVATSGSYSDLTNKPAIPSAQVNSDWNSSSGVSQILNKPTLFSGNYVDLSGKPALGSAASQNASAFDPAGAASAAQSYAVDRSNHIGSQPISTIVGLQVALNSKQSAGNYATLVDGTVPASQLPSYVDDVVEFSELSSFPSTGESGKIYVATGTGKIYRWSGSTYVEITSSPGSTDVVPEGSVNKYYTDGRASAAAPVQSVAGKTGAVTLSKADAGLGNVDNTSDLSKPISTAVQTALDGKQAAGSYATAAQGALADTALQDAPSDGTQYARKDGAWAVVSGGGGNPFDQSLNTTDSPTFGPISINDTVSSPWSGTWPIQSTSTDGGMAKFSADGSVHGNTDFSLEESSSGTRWAMALFPDGHFAFNLAGTGDVFQLNPDLSSSFVGATSFASGAAGFDASGNLTAANFNPPNQSLNTTDKVDFDGLVVGTELGSGGSGYVTGYGVHRSQIIATGSQTPLMIQGGSGAVELWCDSTPTAANSFGSAVPGNGGSNDFVFGRYDGSAWSETFRVKNDTGNVEIIGNITAANLPTSFFSGAYGDLTGTPTFAAVATSGSATDLTTGTLDAARLPSSVARLTANTFTAAQTIASGTLTASVPALAITQTWNNSATTFSAATINVTDTNSSSTSLLADFQTGGVSCFSIAKIGTVTGTGGFSFTPASVAGTFSFCSGSTGSVQFRRGTKVIFTARGDGLDKFDLGSSFYLSWNDDTRLYRDAANTLSQRNGTTAQAFRVFSTYTDASNYEMGVFDWTSNANTLTIGSRKAGTGSNRITRIQSSAQVDIYSFDTLQAARFSSASVIYTPLSFAAASLASDPTTSDLAAGRAGVWKNSTSGVVKLWYNDGGTMKSVALA